MHYYGHQAFWYTITRLGESGIIVPTAIVTALWMAFTMRQTRSAWFWLVPVGIAASVTTLTKLAFLGWGVGIASLDFTGISGHAMFSAAIYPVMVRTLLGKTRPPWPLLLVLSAYAFAALIGVSRVMIHVHSVSEVVSGFAIGSAASLSALMLISGNTPRISSRWLWAGLASWLVVMPLRAAPSTTHDVVTRIAIKLADRTEPFSRADLHRDAMNP
jgi:membrane-associated phospholipid phosphatase